MIRLIKSSYYREGFVRKKLSEFILKTKQVSFGPECLKFERRFAKWQKRKYCVFVSSGSAANIAIVQTLLNTGKIKKGDMVGFSALTWSTNVMPLLQLGLIPFPVDVELDTLNISSKKLINVINKHKIKMLFITNLLGFCDDIDNIQKICKKENIILIEDNCESLGTVYKKKLLGNYGLASTFSFYVGHHMSTIEGGAICTDNEKLANMLRIVRAHGWDRNLTQKNKEIIRNKHKINSEFYSRYTFYDLGYNLRPTEISGFIGNIQIDFLNEIIKKRNENFFKISPFIYKQTSKFFPIRHDHIDFLSNFAIPVICKSEKIRDDLVSKCEDKLELRPIVGGDITSQPFFQKYMKVNNENVENARLIHKQGLYFGNNPELTKEEINQILSLIN